MGMTLSLANNGDEIVLSNVDPENFAKERGGSGFGIAPTKIVVREGALGGGKWRNTRRGPRAVTLPVLFFADDRLGLEDKMRRFARLLNDEITAPRLIATYDDGLQYETEVHYQGGADPVYGADTNTRNWARWVLQLVAPDPYWTAVEAISVPFKSPTAGRGLVRTGSGGLSKLQLASDQTATGDVTVENPGDVAVFPVWTVQGSANFFEARRNVDGQGFKWTPDPEGFADTDQLTIDTVTKLVTYSWFTVGIGWQSQNAYKFLGPAPKLFAIPAGVSSLYVNLDNPGEDAFVAFAFRPKRELVF